jgi:hypothetical protein
VQGWRLATRGINKANYRRTFVHDTARVGDFVNTINSGTQAAQPLFRHAVTEALTNHQNGVIRLAQPISYRLAAGISFLIASCLVAYVALGTVTRQHDDRIEHWLWNEYSQSLQ